MADPKLTPEAIKKATAKVLKELASMDRTEILKIYGVPMANANRHFIPNARMLTDAKRKQLEKLVKEKK